MTADPDDRLVRARLRLAISEYLAWQAEKRGMGVAKPGLLTGRLVYASGKEIDRAVQSFVDCLDLGPYSDSMLPEPGIHVSILDVSEKVGPDQINQRCTVRVESYRDAPSGAFVIHAAPPK